MKRPLAHLHLVILVIALLLPIELASAQAVVTARATPSRAAVGDTVSIQGAGWPAGRIVTATFGHNDYVDWVSGVAAPDGTLALKAVVPRQFTSLSGARVLVTPGAYIVNIISAPGAGSGTVAVAVMLTVIEPPPAPPAIAARFRDYFYAHDGGRLLGAPLGDPRLEDGRRVQYFEKGRLEDHAGAAGDGWRIQFGRLAADLAAAGGPRAVGGDTSSMTYATLRDLALPARRLPPPTDWPGVGAADDDDAVFVPFDTALKPAPGHYVPVRFWGYITQPALFPAGWVHDIGLPLTEAAPATVIKTINGEQVQRSITVQLFERTILTDDPANLDGFHIERANVGLDYLADWRGVVVPGDVVLHPAFTWSTAQRTSDALPFGMRAPAWEWRAQAAAGDVLDDGVALEQQLREEGWLVTGRSGNAVAGAVEAVKARRLQVISWARGSAAGEEAGTSLRVLVGERV